jgi:hypothetical protein
MYAYALNNPLRYTDPTGMSGCQAGDKTFSTCTITITYDPKTSQGTLVVTGQNQGDKSPTTLLTTVLRDNGWNLETVRDPPEYGTQSNATISVTRAFANSETNRLGMALPRGRVRLFRRNDDGQVEVIGENTI